MAKTTLVQRQIAALILYCSASQIFGQSLPHTSNKVPQKQPTRTPYGFVVDWSDYTKEPTQSNSLDLPRVTEHLERLLSKPTALRIQDCSLDEVARYITIQSGLPIVIDTTARANAAQKFSINLPELPLASGLQILLERYELSFQIQGGVVVIFSDSTLKHSHPSTCWLSIQQDEINQIEAQLSKPITIKADKTPLKALLAELATISGLQIEFIKAEGNADSGHQKPVSIDVTDIALRTVLEIVLADEALHYTVSKGKLLIGDVNATKDMRISRIYWLEKPSSQAVSVEAIRNLLLLESKFDPDSIWLLSPLEIRGARRALVLSSTLDLHQRVEVLLRSLDYL